MIQALIRAFQTGGLELTAEEIADTLWLAAYIDPSEPTQEGIIATANAGEIASTKPFEHDRHVGQGSAQTEVHLPPLELGKQSAGAGIQAISFRSPAATALPGKIALARSLRPLLRRISTSNNGVLDEAATAQRMADTHNGLPVLKPGWERWLDLAIVVDDWPSMGIWRQTINEFIELLQQIGAFRTVQTYRLLAEVGPNGEDRNTGQVKLYATRDVWGRHGRIYNEGELVDRGRRRLILILSDCTAPIWYNGAAGRLLALWGKSNMVAIVQMLPTALWDSSMLAHAVQIYVSALEPGLSNAELSVELPWYWIHQDKPMEYPVPVVTLIPESIAVWTKLLTGKGNISAPAFYLPLKSVAALHDGEETTVHANITPEERWQHFRATASPLARQLAGYLSAVPLTLPIMRLVQRVMLPQSRQVHLAEVFRSGIIKRLTPLTITFDPDEIQYDFFEGIRNLLLSTILLSDSKQVLERVSGYVGKYSEQLRKFHALLLDPTTPGNFEIDEDSRPFAHIAAIVLRRLGYQYAELATRLENQLDLADATSHITQANLITLYMDFDLAIEETTQGYYAHVRRSPVGEASTSFTLSSTLEQLAQALHSNLKLSAVNQPSTSFEAKMLGEQLYLSVFKDSVGDCWQQSIDLAKKEKVGLRIRLNLAHAPRLANLPWEYLFDPNSNYFLAFSEYTLLIRYLDLSWPSTTVKSVLPLEVLVVSPMPAGKHAIEIQNEWTKVQRSLDPLVRNQLIQVGRLSLPKFSELQNCLRGKQYHVLHFIGYGWYDDIKEIGGLLFEQESGFSQEVNAETLAVSLSNSSTRLCVFQTNLWADNAKLAHNVAKHLVAQGIPAVLTISFSTINSSHISLCCRFYELVTRGYPIDVAFSAAQLSTFQQVVDIESFPSFLYTRSPHGFLFEFSRLTKERRTDLNSSKDLNKSEPTNSNSDAPLAVSTRRYSFQVGQELAKDDLNTIRQLSSFPFAHTTDTRSISTEISPRYSPTYRKEEMSLIFDCAKQSQSLCLIGAAGIGKSNITNFLNSDPYGYKAHYLGEQTDQCLFPIVDGNTWDQTPISLWKLMLEALRDVTQHLDQPEFDTKLINLSEEQKIFSELKIYVNWSCQKLKQHVMFVLDDFDSIFRIGPLAMLEQLYALRSSGNRGNLSYLIFTRQLPHVLGRAHPLRGVSKFYDTFSNHIYALGLYTHEDSQQMLMHLNELAGKPLTIRELTLIESLAGGHARLLRIIFELWQNHVPQTSDLVDFFSGKADVRDECTRIFNGLHDDEKSVALLIAHNATEDEHLPLMEHLKRRGLLTSVTRQTWFSPLFADFLKTYKV